MNWTGARLSTQHVDGVLEVALHADPLNEIGLDMLAELERVAAMIRDGAGGARAVLFHSENAKGFSAGANLWELHQGLSSADEGMGALRDHASRLFDSPRRATRAGASALKGALRGDYGLDPLRAAKVWGVRAFLDRIHAVFDTFDTAPIPVIAAVHGVCFGGGFELALTADVIVADKTARLAFPELRLGLVPGFGGVPRLERDLGNALVRELLLSGRSLGAPRAHEVGLVAQLVAPGKALDVARKLAKQTQKFDAATVAAAKPFLKPFPARRLAEEKALFCRLLTSPAVMEALDAFVHSKDAMPYLPRARAPRTQASPAS